MTALKVFLIIIAVILILLMFPLKVFLDYDGEAKLSLGYLFLKFQLVPAKPKKKEKKKPQEKKEKKTEAEKKEKKPSTIKRLMDKHGLDGLIEILKEVVGIVTEFLKGLAKHIYFTRCNIRICVVGEDAADTAVKYGYVCSAVYPLISALEQNSVMKKHYTDISAGFLAEKTAAEMELTCKIRPLFLIPVVFRALFKLIGVLLKLR